MGKVLQWMRTSWEETLAFDSTGSRKNREFIDKKGRGLSGIVRQHTALKS